MPTHFVVVYWCVASAIMILCVFSALAVKRTKRTPYGVKLLSLGLLTYDILFLLTSLVTKLFAYTDLYPLWHTSRGFQFAAQIIVCCMAFERYFVLNWPYKYLRLMTERRTEAICISVIVFGFAQLALFRGTVCYSRNRALNCGFTWASYLLMISILLPAASFICFIKIFKIIRRSAKKHRSGHSIRQYKGTIASFMVLVNTTISQVAWLGLSVFYFTRTASGKAEDGYVATLADWSNLVNCIVDPAIYVIWFSETRMQLLKLVKGICPCVKPKIEKLRIEIYQLSFLKDTSN